MSRNTSRLGTCAVVAIFVCLASFAVPLTGLAQVSGTPVTTPPPLAPADVLKEAQAAAKRAEDAAKAVVQVKEQVEKQRDETLAKLDATTTKLDATTSKMIERATWLQSIATYTVGFVTIAGTLAGVLAGVGTWKSLKEAKESVKEAKEKVKEVKESVRVARKEASSIEKRNKDLGKHALLLTNLEDQVNGALVQIKARLDSRLTPGMALIGVPLETGVDLEPTIPQSAYDDDMLIVFADRLQLRGRDLGPKTFAEMLVASGSYWRRMDDYLRAVERTKRAVELDPDSPGAHKEYGRTLWNRVAEDLAPENRAVSAEQQRLLTEAAAALAKAKDLFTQARQHDEEVLYDLATIARFNGDLAGAEALYRRGAQLSLAHASEDGREPDWDFQFALACMFARFGRYQQALDELRGILGKTKSWSEERRRAEDRDYRKWTQRDPDFAPMFADATWRPRIEAFLAIP